MEKEQAREWAKAQSLEVSVDLVRAAKVQLKFLAVVDQNRHLYDGPALERAVYRYNTMWLPLLDKHLRNPISEGPLMVPLDCEWIWHCHRLNPIRYKSDCEKLFGRILGNHNIISSVHGTSKSKSEEMWKEMYPYEPYELKYNKSSIGAVSNYHVQNFTSYDLVSAVKRQIPFNYQVSRPHMSNNLFLQEALARYKGFLYLIKSNIKKKLNHVFVPTYDVDLLWHSHQLNPVSYCDDLYKLMGKVMGHDDTDSDRMKGKKLDIGFSNTTKIWEDTFGLRYWKAGAMNRGIVPTPVTQIPFPYTYGGGKKFHLPIYSDNLIQSQDKKIFEVLLEFVDIKNLPKGHNGDFLVSIRKNQPDKFFEMKQTLSILSESGQKQVANFQCEPSGEFLFELVCHSPSNAPLPNSLKPFGSCSLSLQEFLVLKSKFSISKWVLVEPEYGITTYKPILLHVSLSFTPLMPAPQVFHIMWSQPVLNDSCSFTQSIIRKIQHNEGQKCVTNRHGNDFLCLQMRTLSNEMIRGTPKLLKEVHYITNSGETHTLAEFKGNEWSIKGTNCSSLLRKNYGNDHHLFEYIGDRLVRFYTGRKLGYEQKHKEKEVSNEKYFMTAVEFTIDHPYGKAIGLIDFKRGILKANNEWMTSVGIILSFILFDILKKNGGVATKVDHEDNVYNHITSPYTTEAQVTHGDAWYVNQSISDSGEYVMSFSSMECGFSFNSTIDSGKYESACADCSIGGGGGNCGSKCGHPMEDTIDNGGHGGTFANCNTYRGGGKCGSKCGHPMTSAIDNGRYGSACANCSTSGGAGKCGSKCGHAMVGIIESGRYENESGEDCNASEGGGNCWPLCDAPMED